jgi:hypothetical protein
MFVSLLAKLQAAVEGGLLSRTLAVFIGNFLS